MKYKDFITESPRIELNVDNDKAWAVDTYDWLYNKYDDPKDSWKFEQYKFVEYEHQRTNILFALKVEKSGMYTDEKVALGIKYVINSFKDIGKMYQNTMIQKGEYNISRFAIIDCMFDLIKHYKVDGMICDSVQSFGGKALWKDIAKYAKNDGFEVGVYNKSTESIESKLEDASTFDAWIKAVDAEYYSTDHKSEKFVLYIKK